MRRPTYDKIYNYQPLLGTNLSNLSHNDQLLHVQFPVFLVVAAAWKSVPGQEKWNIALSFSCAYAV